MVCFSLSAGESEGIWMLERSGHFISHSSVFAYIYIYTYIIVNNNYITEANMQLKNMLGIKVLDAVLHVIQTVLVTTDYKHILF